MFLSLLTDEVPQQTPQEMPEAIHADEIPCEDASQRIEAHADHAQQTREGFKAIPDF